jgi:hypothetical protein
VIVREVEDGDLLDRLAAEGPPRSEGLHLSTIYKILMKRLQPDRFDKRDAQGNPLPFDKRRTSVGLLFESMLERGLAEKFATVRPGEVFSDEGIVMTPDGVNPTECAGEEYKSTALSCREGIYEPMIVDGETYHIPRDKFVHFFIQMKGYAKWLGVTRFILTILFIYGDYRWHKVPDCYTDGPCATAGPDVDTSKKPACGGGKHPCGPVFKRYVIDFTQQEIDDNWTMLVNLAKEEGLLEC